jgi:hypothetical protein
MRQGVPLSSQQVARISHLLASTDMPMAVIAARKGCRSSVVANVNNHLGIRSYKGRRATWSLNKAA